MLIGGCITTGVAEDSGVCYCCARIVKRITHREI
jgi:hypothetical protein